ncbi:MAG: HDOD domain-containing protein [Planctomycetota bacterium]|jgi:putative nucleotidyltransferase with HDIG domain
MMREITDRSTAAKVEQAVRQLDSLSTLPCVGARVVSELAQAQFSASALAEIVESDPALTAKILWLLYEQGSSISGQKLSIRRALGRLPAHVVRDALLSVKVFPAVENGSSNNGALLRKELTKHSLAVACCAKDIAGKLLFELDPELAYTAGLLHDIGKFALEEVMPKSFVRIAEEAKARRCSIITIEQKRLGIDHAILGKRLAQKWHLPDQITLGIWLHHSDTSAISENMPEAIIAPIVQLADCIARQQAIGQSGSYDSTDTEHIARALTIDLEQLKQVSRDLPEKVDQKSKALGLESANAAAVYCQTVHAAAAGLARDNSKIILENRRLQTASSHFDFMKDFLSSIDSGAPPMEIAKDFAVRWQKFYQTGRVCLYLAPPPGSQALEAVVVETLSKARTLNLQVPTGAPAIPKATEKESGILDAWEQVGGLLEQLDAEFDPDHTKLLVLQGKGPAVGSIIFELRYPGDVELFRENFEAAASIGGSVLEMALTSANQQHFAEQFAHLLAKVKETPAAAAPLTGVRDAKPQVAPYSPAGLAEMAGGAAHELNNPLSVISGRAQLLAESESDPEKKRMLKQIGENAREISAIINDLMSFARPPVPRATETNVTQMIDEALQLTSQKTNIEHINLQVEIPEGVRNVFVDSAQIVSAVANIMCNSLQSYEDRMGPIKIVADADESGEFVKLQVSDLGRGMDEETVKKATQPFFSGQAAGRRRGMGLAHARRLIELNNGSLRITSRPGSGTTATILLPVK